MRKYYRLVIYSSLLALNILSQAPLTVTANPLLQVVYFRQRWILSACSKEVTERLKSNATIATLVEEGKCFFVICRCLCEWLLGDGGGRDRMGNLCLPFLESQEVQILILETKRTTGS